MAISLECKKILETGIKALEDKKAENIKVIDISEISVISDAIVIASASNTNQIQAITDNIEEELGKSRIRPLSIEGYDKANWVLMDYNDVIFHIFDKENREFYNLDRLYSDGNIIEG